MTPIAAVALRTPRRQPSNIRHGEQDLASSQIFDHRARRTAGQARECVGTQARRVHPRAVATSEQLGSLGRRVQEGRLHDAHARVAGRPRDRRGGKAHPEVFAHKTVRPGRRSFRGSDRPVGRQAGGDRTLVRWLDNPDHRRTRARGGVGRDRSRPFRGVLPLPISALKSASPVLGNPANRNRRVPLTYEQFRYAFANAVDRGRGKELYETFAVPASGKPLFQAASGEPEPVDRGQGRRREPRPRAAAHRRRREGPHGPVGDRQRLVQDASSAIRA